MKFKTHDTELVNGIPIDKKMVLLIRFLWEKGINTRYCCQGWNGWSSYIMFDSDKDAAKFLEFFTCRATNKKLIYRYTLGDQENEILHYCVYFEPKTIKILEEVAGCQK